MTQDEIIELTRQVGGFDATPEFLVKFAKLVAQHEREACAKACEEYLGYGTRTEFAATIRARGQA